MTDNEDEKPFVRLADTEATTEDGDRARMEALSKGGESRSDAEYDALVETPDNDDE